MGEEVPLTSLLILFLNTYAGHLSKQREKQILWKWTGVTREVHSSWRPSPSSRHPAHPCGKCMDLSGSLVSPTADGQVTPNE